MRRCLPVLALLLSACQAPPQPLPTKATPTKADATNTKAPAKAKAAMNPAPSEPSANLCNTDEIGRLVAALASAEPKTHPEVVSRGLADACQMPAFAVHYFELAQAADSGPPVSSADLREYQAVLSGLCPKAKEILSKMPVTAPAYRSTRMFDNCGLDSVGLVERGSYLTRRPTSLMPFVIYQWLLDQGVDNAAAQSIGRAVEVFDRKVQGPLKVPTGVQLPEVVSALGPVTLEPTLYISTAGDSLTLDNESMALDKGAVATVEADGAQINPLIKALETHAQKGKKLAESRNKAWEGRVIVAADAKTETQLVVNVLHAAAEAGYARSALAATTGAFQLGVLPLDAPPEKSDTPELRIHVDSQGFEVSSTGPKAAKPERIAIRPTEGGADAWDFEALAKRAADHRTANAEARVARVSVEPKTELLVLARTITALRGASCPDAEQCVLPSVVLTEPAKK